MGRGSLIYQSAKAYDNRMPNISDQKRNALALMYKYESPIKGFGHLQSTSMSILN